MEALQFGSLSIQETDQGIDFIAGVGKSQTCRVNTDDVPTLMNFLKRHLEDSANRRSSWRLSLMALAGTEADTLEIRLLPHPDKISVVAMDISLTGMLLLASDSVGECGDSVEVQVAFQGVEVTLAGTIVRQDIETKRFAVHFPGCLDTEGTLCPPDAYRDIFYALESIWLDKKLGLQWS